MLAHPDDISNSPECSQGGKGGGEGFEVQKYGDGRVALIGEPHKHATAFSIQLS